MSWQIRATKAGYQITSSEPRDFIFHSAYNTFKIIATGTVSFSGITDGQHFEKTLAHGQSYTPLVFAFMKSSSHPNEVLSPTYQRLGTDPFDSVFFKWVKSNATNIVFNGLNWAGETITAYFKYYIFEVPF